LLLSWIKERRAERGASDDAPVTREVA
jgi:hypothetical protein